MVTFMLCEFYFKKKKTLKHEGEIIFSDTQKLKEFIISGPVL